MHIRVLTLCSWQNTQLFYVFLYRQGTWQNDFELTLVLPSALVVLKLLVLPSFLSKHVITECWTGMQPFKTPFA
jgi:hypothetical protein